MRKPVKEKRAELEKAQKKMEKAWGGKPKGFVDGKEETDYKPPKKEKTKK